MKAAFCAYPGCLAFVSNRGLCCPAHAQYQAAREAKERERATQGWDRLHSKQEAEGTRKAWLDPRWKKLRKDFLAHNPRCKRCGELATDVHHLVRHGANMDIFLDPHNLVALCGSCHAAISRAQRWEER